MARRKRRAPLRTLARPAWRDLPMLVVSALCMWLSRVLGDASFVLYRWSEATNPDHERDAVRSPEDEW